MFAVLCFVIIEKATGCFHFGSIGNLVQLEADKYFDEVTEGLAQVDVDSCLLDTEENDDSSDAEVLAEIDEEPDTSSNQDEETTPREKSMTPEEVHQDVMSSGYWVNLCFELHLSWASCQPGSALNNELAENSEIENFEEVSEVDDC